MKKTIIFLFIIIISFVKIPAQLNNTLQTANAEKFISYLNAKDYDDAIKMFDSTMTVMMSKDNLSKLWLQTIDTYGSYKSVAKKNQQVYGKYKIVELLLDYSTKFLTARIVFDEHEKIAGFYLIPKKDDTDFKAPTYVDNSAFNEENLQFGLPGWELPASLDLPTDAKNLPVVLIIGGSGPQDKDETMNKSKPMRDLAWGLASQGIATFRFDKRTKQHASKLAKIYNTFTIEQEYLEDVDAAIKYLQSRPEIDKNKIYLLGHSQGGNILPRIMNKRKDIAGIIFMAAPVRRLEDLLCIQTEYIMNLKGSITQDEKETLAELKKQANLVKNAKLDTPADSLPVGIPPAYWIYLNNYNPISDLNKVDCRMLVMQGGRDYQVTEIDYKMWQAALKDRAEFKWYPSMNHVFATGEGKITPQEYLKELHVDKSVVDDIGHWVLEK